MTSPDIIALVDLETGVSKINTAIAAGDRMTVIGMKALEAFRTPKGLEALGAKHFGLGIDYAPIEESV